MTITDTTRKLLARARRLRDDDRAADPDGLRAQFAAGLARLDALDRRYGAQGESFHSVPPPIAPA
jgi:hypothetical protein